MKGTGGGVDRTDFREEIRTAEGVGTVQIRAIFFWLLFSVGSTLPVFALLVSQTPGQDRTFDKLLFSLTGLATAASLLIGRSRRGAGQWRSGPISTVILSRTDAMPIRVDEHTSTPGILRRNGALNHDCENTIGALCTKCRCLGPAAFRTR